MRRDNREGIVYSEAAPRENLAGWVQSCWSFDVREPEDPAGYEHFVTPDGCVSILLGQTRYGRRLNLIGPRSSPHAVHTAAGDSYRGVRFWPFAARSILGDEMEAAVGQVLPLAELPKLSGELAELTHSPLDRWHAEFQDWLEGHLAQRPPPDPLAVELTEQVVAARGAVDVAELLHGRGLSPRQLQRRFREATGLTLKQLARLCRFRAAAEEVLRERPRPWCHVALDAGFADQAHLTREFSSLVGLSAGEFRRTQRMIGHRGDHLRRGG